jgi:hypothetical protein
VRRRPRTPATAAPAWKRAAAIRAHRNAPPPALPNAEHHPARARLPGSFPRKARTRAQTKLRARTRLRQASEKDQRGTSTAKKDPDSSKNRAAKDSKESSSGAASGEAGKANAPAEGRNDTSTRSHATLNGEQRARVQSAFKSHRGSAKADANIQVRVGVAVPRTITLYEVPEDVVIIVPEWRRYKYVLIGDEICIIDPDTYEIIDVIAAV